MDNIFENEETTNNFRQLVLTNFTQANRCFMKYLKKLFKEDDVKEQLIKLYEFVESISTEKKAQDFICSFLDLFMGHSMIRDVLIQRTDLTYRLELVRLFCLLSEVQIEIVQFKENIVDFILSVYDASLTIEDQRLLKLLYSFENNGISLQKYQPFIWGLNGAQFYAQKHSQKLAFLAKPKIEEILKDFIDSRFFNSLNAFPIDVKYHTNKVKIVHDPILNQNGQYYDPRFVLPMFFHFLSSESVVKCHLFIKYGCLAYTLASLSSQSKQLRTIAYKVLARLYYHLDYMRYPEDKELWLGLIDFIRCNLAEEDQRIPSIHTVLFVKLVQIFLNPSLSMFRAAKNFILSQQERNYDFKYMPTFYNYCTSTVEVTTVEEHDANMKFCLEWILIALRTNDDIDVCRGMLFDNMMLAYSSGMVSDENQGLILQVLTKLATFKKGTWLLATKLNACLWIKNQLQIHVQFRPYPSNTRTLLNKLIVTMIESALSESEESYTFYPSFEFDIVDVLLKSVYSVNNNDELSQSVEYIRQFLQRQESEPETDRFEVFAMLHSNTPKNLLKLIQGQ